MRERGLWRGRKTPGAAWAAAGGGVQQQGAPAPLRRDEETHHQKARGRRRASRTGLRGLGARRCACSRACHRDPRRSSRASSARVCVFDAGVLAAGAASVRWNARAGSWRGWECPAGSEEARSDRLCSRADQLLRLGAVEWPRKCRLESTFQGRAGAEPSGEFPVNGLGPSLCSAGGGRRGLSGICERAAHSSCYAGPCRSALEQPFDVGTGTR